MGNYGVIRCAQVHTCSTDKMQVCDQQRVPEPISLRPTSLSNSLMTTAALQGVSP
jgi:hypothetical protein